MNIDLIRFDRKKIKKIVLIGTLFIATALFTFMVQTKDAEACACCGPGCGCVWSAHADLRDTIRTQHNITRFYFGFSGILCDYCGIGLLGEDEEWLIDFIYLEKFLPAMMKMTEQFSAVMMQQMLILGQFFDAKQQLEVQRLLQKKEAETIKDYRKDAQICNIGTIVRSLAATERRGDITEYALNAKSMHRQLGNANITSAESPRHDKQSRLEQFKDVFCDRNDNNHIDSSPASGLGMICNGPPNPAERLNADIDYTRTMELPLTLDLDYGDGPDDLTDTEETVMAMANNLYANDVFTRPTLSQLKITKNQDEYMDLRSVTAKRSVAERSFNAIAALKTKGGEGTSDTMQYMSFLLSEVGMEPNDIDQFYTTNPSYLAQMEVLAKNMFQRPQFYAGLYGTPANVARKRAAMEAIGVMLERDIFESRLRSENILSILLELDIIQYQEEVEAHIKDSIQAE